LSDATPSTAHRGAVGDQVADALEGTIGSNALRLQRDNERLKKLAETTWSGTLTLWLIFIAVSLVFVFMYIFIRLVPKA